MSDLTDGQLRLLIIICAQAARFFGHGTKRAQEAEAIGAWAKAQLEAK